MAKSVNKVILIGTLGKDPELKFTPSGTAYAKFSMATNDRYKDKTSGEWKERTEWHNIVCWQRTAEIAGEYLKKGRHVYIEGRLTTRSWDDPNTKQKRYMTEVVCNDLVLLGGGGGKGGDGGSSGASKSSPADEFDQRGGGDDHAAQPPAPDPTQITDDDIPF